MANDIEKPAVLLGIVTRNRAAVLGKAIQSALGQSYRQLNIAVVNDGSTDDTADLAARYPAVQWMNLAESCGYVAARNQLMTETDAEYFVSLDDDAWFLSNDEIGIAINFLQQQAKMAVAAFDILSPGDEQIQQRKSPAPVATFVGCGHVMRLAAFREVGGYVASPGSYGVEEKDLSLRLMDRDYEISILPGVHVWHNKTAVARDLAEQHRSGVCNDFVMTLRRTPLVVLPIALMAKLYRHFRFSRAHNLESSFWKGLQQFVRSLPELWPSRHPVRVSTLRSYLQLSRR
jgi:GT2 family glycosyltransferase